MTQQDKNKDGGGGPLVTINSLVLQDVPISLKASLGEASLSISDLLALRTGSVVKLNVGMNDAIDLRLNGLVVARGAIVAVGDHFGVRITELANLS